MRRALERFTRALTRGGRRMAVLVGRLVAAVATALGGAVRACGRAARAVVIAVCAAITTTVRALRRAAARAVRVAGSALIATTSAALRLARAIGRGAARTVSAILAAGRNLVRRVAAGLARAGRFAISCGNVIVRAVVAGAVHIARVAGGVARALARGAVRLAALLAAAGARAARCLRWLARPAIVCLAGLSRMVARRSPVRGRRLWFMLGIPLAGIAGLSTVASLSLQPPFMHLESMGFAIASTEVSVETPTSSGNAPVLRDLFPLPQWSAVLAEEMTSPELKVQIARQARIPLGQLAIDGPISLDLQRTQQEPTEQKRSFQLLSEGDPYRVTLDTDPNVAAITITAQAPSEAAARQLAHGVNQAVAAYLVATEDSAHLPPADRVGVSQLQPIAITGGSGGHTLAALVFLIVYILWCGAVCVCRKLVRDMRALRRVGPLLSPQVGAGAVRSSIGTSYSDAG